MAPKGNAKAVAARDAKAGREADKKNKETAVKAAVEEEEWSKGAKKDKGPDKAAKAAEAKAAKAARDAALAEEEAALSAKAKPAPKAGAKKAPAKIATSNSKLRDSPADSLPGTPNSGGGIPSFEDALNAPLESFSASNLDDALSLLSLVNEKSDKASMGSKAATTLEAHPERRFKAAFAAYKERTLPELRKEMPGLRLQQYEEVMYKDFKKSPDNPFNQATVAFDASKEDKLDALRKLRQETENRLREQSS